jgi:hypothetical protein
MQMPYQTENQLYSFDIECSLNYVVSSSMISNFFEKRVKYFVTSYDTMVTLNPRVI